MTTTHSWAVDGPIDSPFAHPRGRLGRLAGRFMAFVNAQHEVVDLLEVRPGDRVLEVGYGPGVLVNLLAARTGAAVIDGVDPSADMRDQALRRNRREAGGGRVRLGVGTAEDTGLPEATADRVVSVNNVALWPDLEAGVRELRRVVRPGGTVLLAWHSRTGRSRLARSLGLPEEKLERIRQTLEKYFPRVAREELTNLVAFLAGRDPDE